MKELEDYLRAIRREITVRFHNEPDEALVYAWTTDIEQALPVVAQLFEMISRSHGRAQRYGRSVADCLARVRQYREDGETPMLWLRAYCADAGTRVWTLEVNVCSLTLFDDDRAAAPARDADLLTVFKHSGLLGRKLALADIQ